MSISKNKIAEIRRLHQKKFREQEGLFIVEGNKSVIEVIRSDWEIVSLFSVPGWMAENTAILPTFDHYEISRSELERLSTLQTPQEVMAVVRKQTFDAKSIDQEQQLLVLDGIRNPGNMGTIIRTADWFGMRQILCNEDCVELTNPKVIQASMGSFLRVKVVYADIVSFLRQLPAKRNIYGTFMEGTSIRDIAFTNNDIVIIGNEGKGISEQVTPLITEKITIPHTQKHQTESLNASIAAAILLYELK
ncbi:MAG: RNA methyltransferase [Bacteroidales bacterium]|jgi:TrmH family RNA methyltransferase|nr:RNA methyltransferase [Bacteroidales bacterium]